MAIPRRESDLVSLGDTCNLTARHPSVVRKVGDAQASASRDVTAEVLSRLSAEFLLPNSINAKGHAGSNVPHLGQKRGAVLIESPDV